LFKYQNESLSRVSGDQWKKQRHLFHPAFHYECMIKFVPIFQSKAMQLHSIWDKSGDDFVVDTKKFMSQFSIDVLGLCIFGQDINALNGGYNKYHEAHNLLFFWASKSLILNVIPGIWNFKFLFPSLYKAIDDMQEMAREILNKKLNARNNSEEKIAGKPSDLMDMMLDGLGTLNLDEILANVWTFLFGGHESTSTTLCWTTFFLSKYPDLQEIAREEVDRVIGKGKADAENIKKLVFLDYFIKETLRMRTPLQFVTGRYADKDMVVGDHVLPSGTVVGLVMDAIHHSEEFWPEPEKFDPYRFTPENSKNRHPYAWLPFGLGKRHCIGANFALMEIKIFLSLLLQHYTIHYVKDPSLTSGITNIPKSSLIRLKIRK